MVGDVSIKDEPVFKEAVEAGIYNTDGSFAPPGTPGEQWAVKSEQPTDDNLDKIYKASSEELAKKQRSRGWFQAVFPKKDNQ